MNKKPILHIILILFLSITLNAQNPAITFTPTVQSAIVYLDGAELFHSKSIILLPGRTELVFSNVSPKLISKSIQVTASGEVSILSVTDKLNYLENPEQTPETNKMRDSVKLLNELVQQIQTELEAANSEKEFLLKNQSIGSQEKGVTVAELKLAADFYRSRMKEINLDIFKLNKKTTNLYESINRLNRQLNEQIGSPKGPMGEIRVLLSSTLKQNSTIDLKYIVSDAGWAPSYDIITEDVNKPITLKYRAKVYNNTDVEWKNIKIKLSTGDPMKNASKPELEEWYLNPTNMSNVSGDAYNGRGARSAPSSLSQQNLLNQKGAKAEYYFQESIPMAAMDGDYKSKKDRREMQQQTQKQKVELEQLEISDLSAEFDIATEYSVPTDAKPYIIEVTSYNLPASFKHFSIPKVDKSAFMLAQISGWEELELVSGNANVYLGGTYVGQSFINTKSTSDTLDLSIGRDNKIVVSRAQLKDYNKEKIIGNNKRTTFGYEISVKNNRKAAVSIDLEDQIPVSQSSEITIENVELSKGEIDPLTGKVKWKITLEPGELKKINLSFSVKYPRNLNIKLKKYRTISAPSF